MDQFLNVYEGFQMPILKTSFPFFLQMIHQEIAQEGARQKK